MKVQKIVLSVIDFDGIGIKGVTEAIENARYPNRCISPNVVSAEERDCGEWSDNHPLNNIKTHDDAFMKLFS